MKHRVGIDTVQTGLRDAGLRATTQRVALLHTLLSSSGPVSVEALTKASKGAYDLATAYRTLDALVLAGLAKRIELSQGRALFEASSEHHHHVVCTTCGKIVDIDACLPQGIDALVQKASGFAAISDHSLEFFGICTMCKKTKMIE